jgi:glycosyltransferase involved in cell wall biosynthesis
VVIMNPALPETHQHCLQEAAKLPNVTLINRVPFHEIEQYFAQAKLHVNTSTFEGFPNTFLQAAKYGVPTIAAKVDPGEMLSRYSCGMSCNDDLELLEKAIRLFMTTPERYAEASACCLDYIRTYHDKDKIIPQYENALATLL